MQNLLAQVTRELAVSLADPDLRGRVYAELQASPFREHKIHFGAYLRGSGTRLLSAMAAARTAAMRVPGADQTEARSEAVLATLDSIIDLEFYMPVKEHFAAWKGGSDLLVATSLRDDGRRPIGFDLSGKAVTLSAAEPPAIPTLVIVPVETNFSRTPSLVAPTGVDAATQDIPGIYMTVERVYDDHEGWPNGNPEFEVHLFQTDVDMEYIDQICAGQQQTPPYQYNTEETQTWSGEVLLATEGRLALSPNNQFQVWEDDTGPCTATGGRPPDTESATVSQYASWASALLGVATSSGVNLLKAVLSAIPATYNFASAFREDDEVGTLALFNNCWPSATGPVTFYIIPSGNNHVHAGWARIDDRTGRTRDPICPTPPPPPTPQVGIGGPQYVQAYSACVYGATVNGGTAPYHYAWTADGSPVGEDSPSLGYEFGANSVQLAVTVTDANAETGNASFFAIVDPSAPWC